MQTLSRHRAPLKPVLAVVAVISIAVGTQVVRAILPDGQLPWTLGEPSLLEDAGTGGGRSCRGARPDAR